MFARYLTPNQATERLPLIKSIVHELLDKGKLFKEILRDYEGYDLPPYAERIRIEIQDMLVELEAIGCYYRDWDFSVGIIEFPALIDGEEVLLCWRADEDKVQFYHELDVGFSSRKPIPDYLLAHV